MSNKKDRFYVESYNEWFINGFAIRIWRYQKPGYDEDVNQTELYKKVNKLLKGNYFTVDDSEVIAEKICKIDRVNAVDVKAAGQNKGTVVYKNWP